MLGFIIDHIRIYTRFDLRFFRHLRIGTETTEYGRRRSSTTLLTISRTRMKRKKIRIGEIS